MTADSMLRFAFVVYCAAAGSLLALLPWSAGWDLMIVHLSPGGLPAFPSSLLQNSWIRGLVSGFGLVHLVWVANDLEQLLHERFSDRSA